MADYFRSLCARMADELDHYRQLLTDNRRETHALATEARAELAKPEPVAPTDEELTLVYAYAVAAAVDNKRGPFKQEDAEAAQLAGLRAVLARYGTPTTQPVPVAPTDEELPMPAAIRDMPEQQQRWYALGWRAALARYARPTTQPVPVSERPWKREGWCDAEGRCYGWDGDYWWMVGNPGAANETITHWLPANALPTPEATND